MLPEKSVKQLPKKQEWEELPPVPPDGGWGWVVVVAALFSNILVDGTCMSFGVFLVDLQQQYGEGKGKTAWVGSLIPGLYMATGPLVGALCNKFSCRVVSIIGAVSASVFFFISTFSPNLDVLIFLYGAMGGISLGLMYLPSIVIVGFYFEKKRALATGLAVCGTGIGTMMFAPLFQVMLDKYGWQGSFWIISAMLLNGVVCGAVFRPLQSRRVRVRTSSKCLSVPEMDVIVENSESSLSDKLTPAPTYNNISQEVKRVRSETSVVNKHITPRRRNRTVSEGYNYDADDESGGASDSDEKIKQNLATASLPRAVRPLNRPDIFFCGSLDSIPEFTPPSTTLVANTSFIPSLQGIPEEVPQNEKEESCMSPLLDVLKTIFSFAIFEEISFVLLCIGSLIGVAGFFTPYIYLSTLATDNLGIAPSKATFLLSMLGISNTLGRVLFGWINDRPWANCVLIYNVAPIVSGIATCFVPLMKSYALLMVYCFVFGAAMAAYVTLRTIVLTQLYGIHRLSNTFGLLLLFQGIAALVGSPIAGMIYDKTASYTVSFLSSGGMMIMGGVICLPCRRIAKWQHRKKSLEINEKSASTCIT